MTITFVTSRSSSNFIHASWGSGAESTGLDGTMPTMPDKHILAALLEYRATEHPDRIFLKMPGVAMAWGEFYANVLRVARAYRDAGVRPGDRVAVMLPNCPEFLYAHFGAVCAGLSPVPVNTAQRGETLAFLLRDSGANAIVIDDALWPQYEPVRGDGTRVEIVRG